MRKLKLQIQMSVDGFIAGPNGEMDWTVSEWDETLKDHIRAITDSTDCIILGRKLAEGFIPYWAAHPQEEGAEKINSIQKIVFSKTLHKSHWQNTILAKGSLAEEISKLKQQEGKDIITYGGANFVSALIKQGLVDEFHLLVNPTAIGNGMPIFNALDDKQNLTLVKSAAFNCGIVLLNYKIKNS